MRRPTIVAVALTVLASSMTGPPGAHAAPCYRPPVDAAVSRPFRAPACEWCPGHRGLDYATEPGQSVVAVSAGVVTFAGLVAGVRYVVVKHDDGLRATYGRLSSSPIRQGTRVATGAIVGTTSDLLFFGIRDGERYLDPAPLLGSWLRRPRLLPIDGGAGRPAPPARLACRKSGQVR